MKRTITQLIVGLGLVFISRTLAYEELFFNNSKYRGNEEIKQLFKELKNKYPLLTDFLSIGESVHGRDLWVIRLTSDVQNGTYLKPKFKYVANMHGDEPVGRELLLYLAQYLLHNYIPDRRIRKLLDTVDIYLLPSLNPDGFAASLEGSCNSDSSYRGRENANYVDLNQDFPDQYDIGADMGKNRQPETLAMISWIMNNTFVLSGYLHGGTVGVRYPFDDTRHGQREGLKKESTDDLLVKKLALAYVDFNPQMRAEIPCKTDKKGIINEEFWYNEKGGMQDFNYVYGRCLELNFGLGCCKYPYASDLPKYWENNKESLISFIAATQWGVKGHTFDGNEISPLTEVEVKGFGYDVISNRNGEYWILLLPGDYEIRAAAKWYGPWVNIIVSEDGGNTVVANLTVGTYYDNLSVRFWDILFPKPFPKPFSMPSAMPYIIPIFFLLSFPTFGGHFITLLVFVFIFI